MSSLSTLPKGDSAWLLRKAVQRIMQQVSVLETNIGSSTTGNSANTQVIFNDAGTLRGDAGLTYNAATDTLSAGSATISGALGAAGLNVTGATIPANGVYLGSANNLSFSAASTLGMTLNSTGLGVGVASPSFKLHVQENASNVIARFTGSNTNGSVIDIINTGAGGGSYKIGSNYTIGGAGEFAIYDSTAAATRLLISSSGNVGIGVTPSAWQASWKALDISTIASVWGNVNTSIISNNVFFDGALKYKTAIVASYLQQQSKAFQFFQSSDATPVAGGVAAFTEAMTLDASGNLLVGTTSTLAAWATKLVLSTNSGTTKWAVGPYADPNNFIISASGSFGVYLNGTSAVSWTGISDERLKDIIEPISNAVAKVGQLRSVIGKFKADETNTRRSFLLAQDVQAVLPEAVDASNPDRLGVAYTDVIPLLVAAIKELTARVQTLEAK